MFDEGESYVITPGFLTSVHMLVYWKKDMKVNDKRGRYMRLCDSSRQQARPVSRYLTRLFLIIQIHKFNTMYILAIAHYIWYHKNVHSEQPFQRPLSSIQQPLSFVLPLLFRRDYFFCTITLFMRPLCFERSLPVARQQKKHNIYSH